MTAGAMIARLGSAAWLVLALACGDNNRPAATGDASPDGDQVGDGFRQVEHLARPGINEALLITTDFNLGYNATAPSFAGVPASTLTAVVAEAKTVLKALYLGACLLNGVLGQTPQSGVRPAGIVCHAVGPAVFEADGETLTMGSQMAAQGYADKVFGQFIPDVMRIDTTVDSYYQTLCGDATTAPLLCGGRWLNDDTIDITYDYLLNGARTPADGDAVYDQFSALVSDGVNFSTTLASENGKGSRIPFASTQANTQQGHPAVKTTFPYSAPPL
jgi:hypothetical protein